MNVINGPSEIFSIADNGIFDFASSVTDGYISRIYGPTFTSGTMLKMTPGGSFSNGFFIEAHYDATETAHAFYVKDDGDLYALGLITGAAGLTIGSAAHGASTLSVDPTTGATYCYELQATDVTVIDDLSIGGGYGSAGTTISAAGDVQANGGLTVDGASSIATSAGVAATIGNTTGVTTIDGTLRTATGVGAIVANKATVVENMGNVHQTVLTLTLTGDNDIDLADGDHGTGVKVYDFPEGNLLILGTVLDASVDYTGTNGNFTVAVGSAQAADDNSLADTEATYLSAVTIDGSQVSPQDAHGWSNAMAFISGATTAGDVYINVACADASNTGAQTYAITGTLTITWVNVGDF